jgi:hypothetical protein
LPSPSQQESKPKVGRVLIDGRDRGPEGPVVLRRRMI